MRYLILLLILSGCASIPDIKIVKPLPWDYGAYETSTLSTHKKDYTKEEWDDISWRYICLSPEEWTKIKAALIKLCKTSGSQCTQTVEKVDQTNEFIEQLMKGVKGL